MDANFDCHEIAYVSYLLNVSVVQTAFEISQSQRCKFMPNVIIQQPALVANSITLNL